MPNSLLKRGGRRAGTKRGAGKSRKEPPSQKALYKEAKKRAAAARTPPEVMVGFIENMTDKEREVFNKEITSLCISMLWPGPNIPDSEDVFSDLKTSRKRLFEEPEVDSSRPRTGLEIDDLAFDTMSLLTFGPGVDNL